MGHCLNLGDICEIRVDPSGVIFRPNNDRHAAMNFGHQWIGIDGENGESSNLPFRALPMSQEWLAAGMATVKSEHEKEPSWMKMQKNGTN